MRSGTVIFVESLVLCLWATTGALTDSSPGYNPDAQLPTPKIIKRYGYNAESHEVLTEDGYILTIHRIPNKNKDENKIPVFLQHGLLDSSAGWVINGPGRSIAYLMADKGHDVWLGNSRGNVYSRAHVSLSPSDQEFWNFSWHEMGYYDLPAVIDYVLNNTGYSSLYYIGHSMGTTMSYVLCSTKPEYNDKIKTVFSFAPVAYMSRATSPLRYLAPFAKNIELIAKSFGPGEFLPRNTLMNYVLKYSCEVTIFESKLCEHYIFIICGHDPEEFNMKLLPVILGHSPAGASTKTLVHFAQLIESGKFQQFDYGEEENLKIYGIKDPPQYNLSEIIVPVSLHYGDNDLLANVTDVARLYHLLPNPIGMFRVNFSLFNHLDFLWSIDVYELLYKYIEYTIDGRISDTFFMTNDIPAVEDYKNMWKKKLSRDEPEYENDVGYITQMKEAVYSKWYSFKDSLPVWKECIKDKLYEVKSYVW